MKTKNLILALVAIAFAVGSAFASKYTDKAAYARVWLRQFGLPSDYLCTKIPQVCNESQFGSTCTVMVVLSNGMTKSVKAYSDTDCFIELKHTAGFPLIYDAGEGDRPFDARSNVE
jgi:hypothetical protein